MLCQEENNSLTATLEQSKNTKITTLQMATAFKEYMYLPEYINITACPEIAKKQENIL